MLRIIRHRSTFPIVRNRVEKLIACRPYWGFSKAEEESGAANFSSSGSSDKSLVSRSGDHAPNLSPVLILPTNRKPIFPGFLSAVTVYDEATIEALINSKDNAGYVGVFLRKDSHNHPENPDIVNSPSQLYNIGTFSQVQSVLRSDIAWSKKDKSWRSC